MPCLLPKYADMLLDKFRSGEMTPAKLMELGSEARHKYFAGIVGEENAGWVNAKLESKLILKYQQKGIVNWAKSIANLKPEIRRDMLARVQRMEKVLQPKELDNFLADLAAQRLGVGVTVAEATKIYELSKTAQENRAKMEAGPRRKRSDIDGTPTEMEYGRALVGFNNYIAGLKRGATQKTFREWLGDKPLSDIGGLAKSFKGTADNSSLFRQGWKTLLTHPKIWHQRALRSWRAHWDTWGGKNVVDEQQAAFVSDPDYERAKIAKLDIGNVEEAYPITIPEELTIGGEKIPGISQAYKAPERLYRGSENAFATFLRGVRFDTFKKTLDIAEKSGIDINNKEELMGLGRVVNSLGARGHLGKLERAADVTNNLLFSPRNLKSHIDVLMAPGLYLKTKMLGPGEGMTDFARKRAAIESTKILLGNAAILAAIAGVGKALDDEDIIDLDMRSSNFGKVRIRDTRFDITGGMASVFTLAARLATMSTKSGTTGTIKKLNVGEFAGRTGADVAVDFFSGKLSPAASVIRDLLEGTTFEGKAPTIGGEIGNLFIPLPITNIKETLDNPNAAPLVLSLLADAVGIGANTYSAVTWYSEEEENRIGEKYNIQITDNNAFIPLMNAVSKGGVSLYEPKTATVAEKKLTGKDLEEYKMLRFAILKNLMLERQEKINARAKDPKALDALMSSIKQAATDKARAEYYKQHKGK